MYDVNARNASATAPASTTVQDQPGTLPKQDTHATPRMTATTAPCHPSAILSCVCFVLLQGGVLALAPQVATPAAERYSGCLNCLVIGNERYKLEVGVWTVTQAAVLTNVPRRSTFRHGVHKPRATYYSTKSPNKLILPTMISFSWQKHAGERLRTLVAPDSCS